METRRNTGIEEKNLRICGVYEDLQIVSKKKKEKIYKYILQKDQ
jgi:hypothetical protein